MNLDVLMNLDMKLMLHVYEMRWQIYHLHTAGARKEERGKRPKSTSIHHLCLGY
jgi:hypothetical protein